jgi:uncharacterized membrane protein YgcG
VSGMRGGRAAAAGALAVVTILQPASTAHAAGVGSGYVTDFDVDVEIRPDGVLEVHESITYAFDDRGHGILRSIPYLYRWNDRYDRETELGTVAVSSRTAPVDVEASRHDGQLVLRIGDPERLIRGSHTYELDYTVEGALNERGDHVELAWNGVGDQWSTRIEEARINVHAPALLGARCFNGPVGSDESCGTATRDGVADDDGQVTVTFGPEQLRAYEAMTVYADLPAGSVRVAAPVLVERRSLRHAFSVTPLTVGLSAGLLALAIALVAGLRVARGREVRAVTGLRMVSHADTPVDWRAIQDMRPAPVGTLADGRVEAVAFKATLVDLAIRGYLRIEEVGTPGRAGHDWRLVRLDGGDDDLLPYERALLEQLFPYRPEVHLGTLQERSHYQFASLRHALYDEVVRRGWYRVRPDLTRRRWYLIGAGAVVLAVAMATLLAAHTAFGLVGMALVLAAAALLLAARAMPARTVAGRAALQQVEALRHHLSTAGPQADRLERGEQTFSALLPYAMVLGLERRWASEFATTLAQPAGIGGASALPWFADGSADRPLGAWDGPGHRLRRFMDSSGSAMAAGWSGSHSSDSSSWGGSSDSSGGSGGGAGGGAGGGGGGGW